MPELKKVLYKILGTWDNSKFIFFDKTGKQIK
jgi:hypothetical protein